MRRICFCWLNNKDEVENSAIDNCISNYDSLCTRFLLIINKPRLDDASLGECIIYDGESSMEALRKAIVFIGWKDLRTYDELIFIDTCSVALIDRLDDIFNRTVCIETDSWILKEQDSNNGKLNAAQLIAFRNTLLESEEFKNFWDIEESEDYRENDLFGNNFAKLFERQGFRFETVTASSNSLNTTSVGDREEIVGAHEYSLSGASEKMFNNSIKHDAKDISKFIPKEELYPKSFGGKVKAIMKVLLGEERANKVSNRMSGRQ